MSMGMGQGMPPDLLISQLASTGMFGGNRGYRLDSGIGALLGPELAQQWAPTLQMSQLFLPMIFPRLQQQGGFMPNFASTQNYFHQLQAMQFSRDTGSIIQGSQGITQDQLYQILAGGSRMLYGRPLAYTEQMQSYQMARNMAPIMNIMNAMMPTRMADMLYGASGNPTRMAQNMQLAGMQMYDPITGARGHTAATTTDMSRLLFSRMYGDPAAISAMLGTGAGEMGELANELSRRGMLGTRRPLMDLARTLPAFDPTSNLGKTMMDVYADRAGFSREAVDREALDAYRNFRNTGDMSYLNSTSLTRAMAQQLDQGALNAIAAAGANLDAVRASGGSQEDIDEAAKKLNEAAAQLADISNPNDSAIKDIITNAAIAAGRTPDRAAAELTSTQAAIRAAVSANDVNAIEQLKNTASGQILLRDSDASRVVDQLKKYNEAVVAIREIFGDAGHPDAPIPALLNGLNALSQGGLTGADPEQLAQAVRRSYALARRNNISLEAQQALVSQGAELAASFGGSRRLGLNATDYAFAFAESSAMNSITNQKAFGTLDREALTLLQQQRAVGAATSTAARGIGMLMSLDAQGVNLPAQQQRIVDAIKNKTSLDTLGLNPSELSVDNLRLALIKGGVAPSLVNAASQNLTGQDEQIVNYDLGGRLLTDGVARAEALQRITATFTRSGLTADAALNKTLADRFIELGIDFETTGSRVDAVAAALQTADAATLTALQNKYKTTDPKALAVNIAAEAANVLQGTAAAKNYGNAGSYLATLTTQTASDIKKSQQAAAVEADLMKLMAPLGKGNAVSRFMDAMRGGSSDISDVLNQTFGLVDPATVRAQIGAPAAAMVEAAWAASKEIDALNREDPDTNRAAIQRNMQVLQAIMSGGAQADTLLNSGMALSPEQRAALQAAKNTSGLPTVLAPNPTQAAIINPDSIQNKGMHLKKLIASRGAHFANDATAKRLLDLKWEEASQADVDAAAALLRSIPADAQHKLTDRERENLDAIAPLPGTSAAGGTPGATAVTPAAPTVSVKIPDKFQMGGKVKIEGSFITFDHDTFMAVDPAFTAPANEATT